MCKNCWTNLAKFILLDFNAFSLLIGLLMLGFGITIVAAPDSLLNIVGQPMANIGMLTDESQFFDTLGILMIVIGSIVSIIALIGLLAVCLRHKTLLSVYLFFVIFAFCLDLAYLVVVFCYPNTMSNIVKKEMNNSMIESFDEDFVTDSNFTMVKIGTRGYAWAYTQIKSKCCGTYDYTDYARIPPEKRIIVIPGSTNTTVAAVPVSCCSLIRTSELPDDPSDFVDLSRCLKNDTSPPSAINEDGCFDAVFKKLLAPSDIFIAIAIICLVFLVIVIVAGFILLCQS